MTSEVVGETIRQAHDLDVQRTQLAAVGKEIANLLSAVVPKQELNNKEVYLGNYKVKMN